MWLTEVTEVTRGYKYTYLLSLPVSKSVGAQDSGFRGHGLGFRVYGLGFRVDGLSWPQQLLANCTTPHPRHLVSSFVK